MGKVFKEYYQLLKNLGISKLTETGDHLIFRNVCLQGTCVQHTHVDSVDAARHILFYDTVLTAHEIPTEVDMGW